MPSELKELKSENNNFNNNFLEVAANEATCPPDPNANPMQWVLTEKVEIEQPQQYNYPSERRPDGNEGPANQCFSNGDNKQSPRNIEPARRPPPERDRYQKQGCRAYQTVSRKGVLDTLYPRIRVSTRMRVPIQIWCPLTGTRLAGRQARRNQ